MRLILVLCAWIGFAQQDKVARDARILRWLLKVYRAAHESTHIQFALLSDSTFDASFRLARDLPGRYSR